ncbi:MAG: Txe/YoeB family addiction module toxin [Lachnospiraceae bacterium]|uniref:Txe/YoeB family addiction module toxin n=1 Tax=Candidatus Merdisoma sp. JLR.KK011 TaxID=3114299 RepID=UPI0014339179|nr:Txe/YoeB family addiction module toxin [Lachnospiraceae bacterium]MCI9250994.1 Txe/YoeB family addiction module toxin [Lachnospiraceae bacterium]MCI9384513.1 Txe/YoeB family addiction module toxin [Lachnospiraceae bacterium]MCI9624220.1 Txe/YoeB family addiction module toxin [Lachnospiraceae bacterium]GFI10444.1 toxin YoeB [Lachnospiraceae bacterium]
MYIIRFSKRADKDKKLLKGAGLVLKAKTLLDMIAENPFQNPPPYEGLVGNLNGYYSRRINIQHRLVYQVYNEPAVIDGTAYEGTIKVIRMWSHYDAVR